VTPRSEIEYAEKINAKASSHRDQEATYCTVLHHIERAGRRIGRWLLDARAMDSSQREVIESVYHNKLRACTLEFNCRWRELIQLGKSTVERLASITIHNRS